MARKVGAYQKFVGKQLKAGKSMKTAASMWKRGVRRNDPGRKRPAKRNYGTKAGALHAARAAGYGGKARGAKHSYFRQLGLLGAAKRWHKKRPYHLVKKAGHLVAANDPGRKRGYRGYRRNPAGFAAFKDSFKDLLKMDTFVEAAMITGGGLLSVAVPNLIIGSKLGDKLPDVIKTGWGKYLVNLAAAGLASGAAAWFGQRRLARNFLIGGVAFTVNTLVLDVLKRQATAAGAGETTKKLAAAVGVSGLGVLPSSVEAAVDKAVEAELARQGLRDQLPGVSGVEDYLQPGVSDFMNPGEGEGMEDYLQPGMQDVPSASVI
jgi:hypothetical protein